MPTPTTDRQYLLVSSTGNESSSDNIIVKNSYWTVFLSYNKISLNEYNQTTFFKFRDKVNSFYLTPALDNSNNILTDRFWIWEIKTDSSLRLLEIEPFSDQTPTIYEDILLESNGALSIRADVQQGKNVRAYILKQGSPNELYFRIYTDLKSAIPYFEEQLSWSSSRLDKFDAETPESQRDEFYVSYSDTASPPNIYTVDYSLSVPSIINAVQIGDTLNVQVEWDTITGAENYRVERSINDPTFAPANTTVIYNGPLTTAIDTVPSYGTDYYYRSKLEMPTLSIESDWSSGYLFEMADPPLAVDFVGSPLSGECPLVVQFTDLSVGAGILDWEWNFGDGTSVLNGVQNPVHVFSSPGEYTVSLTVYKALIQDTVTKTNYVSVNNYTLDYSATPRFGSEPLSVQFTSLVTGITPDDYIWDFGDSNSSTEKNPNHIYFQRGSRSPRLTIRKRLP